MGGTWSALLLMWAHIASALSAITGEPILERVVFLNLAREVLRTELVTSTRGAMYLHVDDTIICQRSAGWTWSVLRVLSSRLRNLGFVVTVEWPGEVARLVGVHKFDQGRELAPSAAKLGHLDRVLEEFENADLLLPGRVATLLGIYVWFGPLWRPSLAAVSNLCKWLELYLGAPKAPAWPSLQHELALMRAFPPFIRTKLGRRVSPAMLAQDAAGPGDTGAGPFGSLVMAVGFPSLPNPTKVWASRDIRGATIGPAGTTPRRCGALSVVDAMAAAGGDTDDPREWIPVSGFRSSVVTDICCWAVLSKS